MKLEQIAKGALISGIEPGKVVRVMSSDPLGDNSVSVVYRTDDGRLGERQLFRADGGRHSRRDCRPPLELRRRRCRLQARHRGLPHQPRASVRPDYGGPHVQRRAAPAPDHRRLRIHAAQAAASVCARRRSRCRQDHHGGPADPRALDACRRGPRPDRFAGHQASRPDRDELYPR